jgi:flagellar hook-associated protein 3 FlgL
MRISTLTFRTSALDQMQQLESDLATTQSQLSSGKKLQSAADDPVGMAQVNQLNAELSASQQYVTNGDAVGTNLKLEEQALTNATNVLQSARDLAVEANDGSLSVTQRQAIATQLQQLTQQLVAIGNATDGSGNYLFGGYANTTKPFAQSGSSVSYAGSDQVSQVQISANQRISGGDAGSSVFMNIPAGNGTFTTAAAGANTGSASIDPGTVTNAATWAAAAGNYTIAFTSSTAYQVTDGSGNVVTSGTYTSPTSIAFDGIQTTIAGTPAPGDTFTIAPAGKSSAFSTLSNLANTLNSTTLTRAQVTSAINTSLQQIDNALTNLNTVQASVGARVNAVTAAQSSAQTEQTDVQTRIHDLSDVDYAAATTQLSTEELALQAAQESYASISKLSLFNYIQ